MGVNLEERVSLTYAECAEATGYSIPVIKNAADRGELRKGYANTKPVVSVENLKLWVASLPDTPPKK
jgi:hypothetical protein